MGDARICTYPGFIIAHVPRGVRFVSRLKHTVAGCNANRSSINTYIYIFPHNLCKMQVFNL